MTAGTLEIQLLANLARLQQDMTKATGIVGSSMKSIEGAVSTAKSALGALGIGLSIAGIAKLAADTVHATAALDDMAEQTGATVEGLSKIQTVAKIGGHEFGGVTEAIGRMIKGLKGADEVGQAAGQGLAFLGIEAKDMNGRFRDSAEILQDVAKALSKYEDGGNKVALVQDILGKSGAKYMSLLKDMAEEGEQHAKVTAKQAAEAEALEKNMNRLKIAGEDAKREFMIGITPALVEFTEKLVKAQRAGENLISALFTVLTVDTNKTGPQIDDRIREITAEIDKLDKILAEPRPWYRLLDVGGAAMATSSGRLMRERAYLEQLRPRAGAGMEMKDWMEPGAGALNYTSATKAGASGAADADSAYRNLLKTLKEKLLIDQELTELAKLQLSLDALSAKQLATITPARKVELETLAKQVDLIKQQKVETEAYLKVVESDLALQKEVDDLMRSRQQKVDDAIIATEKIIDQIKFETTLIGLSNEEREISIALRDMETKGIEKESVAFEELAVRIKEAIGEKELVEKNKKAADEINEFWKSAAQGMQQSMSSFFFDIMQGNLTDLSGSFKRTIDKMVADQLAAKAATTLFGDDPSKSGGGGGGGGWVGIAMSAMSAYFGGGTSSSSGSFGTGAGYAQGTDYVPRTGLALVHQGERITPAGENKGSAMRVTNIFHVSGQTDTRSQAQISAAAGEGVQRAMARNS